MPKVRHHIILMLELKRNASFIVSTLKNQQSTLIELETPQISLRRLEDMFKDRIDDRGDVLRWFSDNQCNLVINLAEQKWSRKSIFIAVSVIAIGVAQIALGAVLLVGSVGTTAFICNGLISEGVSDMIFGLQGLAQGHCNWSQYFDHKLTSLAITVATAGIGAYLGRGVQVSRYAYKAFGSASMELAKSSAEQTGKSLGKVITKQVVKKIAKDSVGATVDAGISIACDKIVEELSQSVDDLSQCIIESFESISKNTKFNEKVNAFFDTEDPEKAEKYLHQMFTRVKQRKTFLEIWDDIESKLQTVADVGTQAHGNASSHLQMANKKLKGTRVMKGIGYVSRFAPLITEPVKIGLVNKKMDVLIEDLIRELSQHSTTKHEKEPLDSKTRDEILMKELNQMKQNFSQEISQRGKKILSTGLQIVGQELKKHATASVKEVVIPKIREHVDMTQLMRYDSKLSAARSEKNCSMVIKYEEKMKRLMSRTRSPKVFALLIEDHNAELGPAFAIPALECILDCRIKLVNKDGRPLLNVQEHH